MRGDTVLLPSQKGLTKVTSRNTKNWSKKKSNQKKLARVLRGGEESSEGRLKKKKAKTPRKNLGRGGAVQSEGYGLRVRRSRSNVKCEASADMFHLRIGPKREENSSVADIGRKTRGYI